jgi:peptide/nickel transport system permease protein
MMETTSGNVAAPPQGRQRSTSRAQIVWEQFRKHQLAVFGGLVLAVLYVGALFAPFISPYGADEYSTTEITKYVPPTHVYFRDPQSGALSWPFVYAFKRELNLETFVTEYTEDRSRKFPVRLLVRRPEQPYRILGLIPSDLRLFGVDAPGKIFLAGSDGYGRDLFTRIWFGARISLSIGLVAIAISYVLGLVFGGIAGYYGGWVDNLIMRFVEVIGAIPTLFLLIALTGCCRATSTRSSSSTASSSCSASSAGAAWPGRCARRSSPCARWTTSRRRTPSGRASPGSSAPTCSPRPRATSS